MNNDNLLNEMFDALRKSLRQTFILIIITIVGFFLTNAFWIYTWSLIDTEITESYELEGDDSANVIYNRQGQVQIDNSED